MRIKANDPMVRMVQELLAPQIKKAMDSPRKVENGVLPIFALLNSETVPEQIASGVVVRIGAEHFVFSASHVFDPIGQLPLLVGLGDGSRLRELRGDRFSTSRGASGTHNDDPIDASVFHIQSGVPPGIAAVALDFSDLDYDLPEEEASAFLVTGFRVKETKAKGNRAFSNRACYPSLEYGPNEYAALKLDTLMHIAIAFDDQVVVNDRWENTPLLRGVSGGAIIRVKGVTMRPPFAPSQVGRQLLTGIAIEHRRGKAGKPPAVVGTRVSVHLSLIRHYLPDLEFK